MVSDHLEAHQGGINGRLSSGVGTTRKPAVFAHPLKRNETTSPIDTSTASNAEILEQPTKEQARAEVKAVLATETFRRSRKLSRLLSYLCDKYFAGEANGVKEYCIAVGVLGRDSEFDPQLDAAVRVDVYYLRKRLNDCYSLEARDHRVQITLPKGQYIPQFLLRSEPEISAPTQPQDKEEEIVSPVNLIIAGKSSRERPTTLKPKRRWLLLALAGATGGALLWMIIVRPWQQPAKAETGIQNGSNRTAAAYTTAASPVALTSESEVIRILAGEHGGNYVDKEGLSGSLIATLWVAQPSSMVRARLYARRIPIFFEAAGRDSSCMISHSNQVATSFISTLPKLGWTAKACAVSAFPSTESRS
jgi:hypothetical protein